MPARQADACQWAHHGIYEPARGAETVRSGHVTSAYSLRQGEPVDSCGPRRRLRSTSHLRLLLIVQTSSRARRGPRLHATPPTILRARGRPRASLGRLGRCGGSAFDLVVNSGHHRLVQLDPGRVEDRDQGGPERLESLLGLPDIEDLDLAVCLKGDVGDAPIRGSRARLFELAECCVVLLLREPLTSDVKAQCHSIPIPLRVSAVACPAIGPLYVTDRERRIFRSENALTPRADARVVVPAGPARSRVICSKRATVPEWCAATPFQ